VGVESSSRFPFKVWTHTHTHTHKVTDASYHPINASATAITANRTRQQTRLTSPLETEQSTLLLVLADTNCVSNDQPHYWQFVERLQQLTSVVFVRPETWYSMSHTFLHCFLSPPKFCLEMLLPLTSWTAEWDTSRTVQQHRWGSELNEFLSALETNAPTVHNNTQQHCCW